MRELASPWLVLCLIVLGIVGGTLIQLGHELACDGCVVVGQP